MTNSSDPHIRELFTFLLEKSC
jgi:gamma-tubulin complex component 2